jgi:UDP-N-acetylmuramoylalanine--D-glutamate ligase
MLAQVLDLTGQTVLVLGLGESGLAIARWVGSRGARLRVADTRAAPPMLAALRAELPDAQFAGGELMTALLDDATLVALSPGLSPSHSAAAPLVAAARERGIAVVGEIELFARALAELRVERGYRPRVVGVTGTNGKTTTTRLAGLLIERAGSSVAVAGNISPTALDTLRERLAADALPQVWVLELSSFQLATTDSLACDAATVLNVTQDHLDWHGTMDEYVAAKARIFGPDTVRVLNRDDPRVLAMQPQPVLPVKPTRARKSASAKALKASGAARASVRADAVVNAAAAADTGAAADATDVAIALFWPFAVHRSVEPAAGAVEAEETVFTVLDSAADDRPLPERIAEAERTARERAERQRQPHPPLTFGASAPAHPDEYGLVRDGGLTWLAYAEDLSLGHRRRKAAGELPGIDGQVHVHRLMPLDALRLRGRHNALNALAALALARAIGCALAPMLHALRDYRGEPHRVQTVASFDGIDYVDDSKGTNVGATVAALDGLGAEGKRLVVILGGDGKGQDFAPLAAPLAAHARAVLLIGRDAELIAAVLGGAAYAVERAATLSGAVQRAAQFAQPGDAVLLSPACASLDMFRNYKHRAEVFVDAVHELANKLAAERGQVI